MQKTILAVGLCLLACPAVAQDLRGQWHITVPSQPGYTGTVLIDAQRRATWDSPADYGRPARFVGYVADADSMNVRILFTDRSAVVQARCAILSSDLMHCGLSFADGRKSPVFVLTRVGPGPHTLTKPSG